MEYFSHDHACSRAYRWDEDGLAGVSDERQRLCFSLALWNGKDAILKERLFELTLLPQRVAAEMSKLKTSREVLRRRRIR
jgi:hypothetical protein